MKPLLTRLVVELFYRLLVLGEQLAEPDMPPGRCDMNPLVYVFTSGWIPPLAKYLTSVPSPKRSCDPLLLPFELFSGDILA